MTRITLAALAALTTALAVPGAAFAGSADVVVESPWARASIGTSRPGVAYLTLRNTGDEAVKLTGVTTPVAKMPEIHRTGTDDQGASTMRPAGDIAIAPGETVALEPGGLHMMLMQLQGPMNEGETFPLTLRFADGGEVTVEVPILGLGARGPDG